MFANSAIRSTAVLLGLLTLCVLGCGDSPGDAENSGTLVSPQPISLPGPGNPFRPDTEIVFVMPQSGQWSAWITSIFADTVRSYYGHAKTGETVRIVWDGDDDHGMPEPDGIYFARVAAGKYEFTKKLLLIWRP